MPSKTPQPINQMNRGVARPTAKELAQARAILAAEQKQPVQQKQPVTQAVTVTEVPNEQIQAHYLQLIAKARPLPDTINNNNYITSQQLYDAPHFFILGAEVGQSNIKAKDGSTQLAAFMRVLVPIQGSDDQYEECLWTPGLSPERSRVIKHFVDNPQDVVGPLTLEPVDVGQPQPYMRLVQTDLTPF